MYEATPVVHGFPGKAVDHGSFGWSSVWLLRGHGRVVMVETGPPSYLPLLTAALADLQLGPGDVTDVLITHAHWDHVGNVSLFPSARRWIGEEEYLWAASRQPEEPFVSQPLLSAVSQPEKLLRLVTASGELFPGVTAHEVPGHTPGHLAFEVETSRGRMLFAGDAAKNVHELEALANDSAIDPRLGAKSLAWIRNIVASGGGAVVPGHDVPCVLVDGRWQREREQVATLDFFHRRDGVPARITISDVGQGMVTIRPDD